MEVKKNTVYRDKFISLCHWSTPKWIVQSKLHVDVTARRAGTIR